MNKLTEKQEQLWRKTTCAEARKMAKVMVGVMVWWRPNGLVSKDQPEKDLALYKE